MRSLLAAGLLLAAPLAGAERRALIVGVDQYPWITDAARTLKGAATDVSLMERTLKLYGYTTTTLLRKEATRAAIVSEIERMAGGAKAGDELVFYFSGRGAVSQDGQPLLVPADGKATASDADIRMARLEDWARLVSAQHAQPTLIVDASFVNPGRSDYGRQYNPTPRCIVRGATDVRKELFTGPGVFLSACPAQGAAYEWLVNSAEERWAGAFTDSLTNTLVAGLHRGENPTILDAMREVQGYFKDKVRAGYMPGLAPQPEMAALMANSARYETPMFGGVSVKTLPADSKLALDAAERQRKAREGKTRIAFETDDPKLRTNVERRLRDFLKDVPDTDYAPPGEPPDVIFRVSSTGKGVEATVVGDDLDKTRTYKFPGKDFGRALDGGLGDYISLRAVVGRLYRLTEGNDPTWSARPRFVADAASVARGEGFRLTIETPEPALLFILDRDDADGILQLAFPQPGAPYAQKVDRTATLEARAANDSSDGRMMLRAVLVPAAQARVPELKMDDKAFRDRLLQQLQRLVSAMESGKLPWTARTVNLGIH